MYRLFKDGQLCEVGSEDLLNEFLAKMPVAPPRNIVEATFSMEWTDGDGITWSLDFLPDVTEYQPFSGESDASHAGDADPETQPDREHPGE